ncbi:MAG TPA: L,D-transpeptidase family protein, partial [Rhizomicrobium sp.]
NLFRSASLIAAMIAGASSAAAFDERLPPAAATQGLTQELEDTASIVRREPGSTQYAQSFLEQLFGAPRQDSRMPAGREQGTRDTYIRSREQSGKPGPAYRVLGVVPNAPTNRAFSQVERWKKKIAQDLLKAPPAPPTQGPLLLAVSLAKQTVTLYDAGVAIAKSPVSTGTTDRPTPTGIFSVLEKQWWHRSNLYSAAPMPYMQRITWTGVALHAGELPGYAASHGCIRLPESFALRLWGTTKVGARVIITRDEVVPVEIKHARLFAPKPKPEPAVEPKPEDMTPPENKPQPEEIVPPEIKPLQEEMSVSIDAPLRQFAAATPFIEYTAPPPSPRAAPAPVIVTPQALSGGGPRVIVVADALAQLNNTQQTAVAPPVADEDDDPADSDIDDATRQALQQVELVDPERTVINGTTEVTINLPGQPAQTVLLSVEKIPSDAGATPATEPGVMLASLDGSLLPLPSRASGDSQLARKTTPTPAEPVSTLPKVLRPGPLSILISRKEQRMYVRKGFEPLFEVPVTVGKASEPIGTYVFTAVAAGDDQAALRWTVMSLDGAPRAEAPAADMRNVAGKRVERVDPKLKATAAARAALDRLDLPQDAVDRVADLMSVGATLIVTDKGIGRRAAAALDSDFMILTP